MILQFGGTAKGKDWVVDGSVGYTYVVVRVRVEANSYGVFSVATDSAIEV